MTESNCIASCDEGSRPIKAWTRGVEVDERTSDQLRQTASMPFVFRHLAVMPDAHWGLGSTVGSVIPTRGAIIPAAVGVDIGCGMIAQPLDLAANDLPDNLASVRASIEAAIPHGRSHHGGADDIGSHREPGAAFPESLTLPYRVIVEKQPKIFHNRVWHQFGTLGSGNHFIELCLDESDQVWAMLHSGSRGAGNRIGTYFIAKAKEQMARWHIQTPNPDLAYLPEGDPLFNDYIEALEWAQFYAARNRVAMMGETVSAIGKALERKVHADGDAAVNCHHNYATREHHFGENVWVTRKGAVRARTGDMGIIPGAMGRKSFIVRGMGNPESFHSCSHGAGRIMSRTQARKTFTVEDHAKATEGLECLKTESILDETPGAYKDIDTVMAAQSDLVGIVHTLRAVVCVKGE